MITLRRLGGWHIALLASMLGPVAGVATAADDPVEQLLADEPATRSRARDRLLQPGAADPARLDPHRSGCLDADQAPPHCRNYAAYLAAVVDILARISAYESAAAADRRPARDLLWSMLFDPAVDPFSLSDAANLDGPALRRRAERALRAAMALPTDPTQAAASAAAVASTRDRWHAWFILQACAGNTQSTGCRYGSYLYGADGRLVSASVIEVGAADNPGGGVDEWRLALKPGSRLPRMGVELTRGSFGGDVDRVVLRELGPRQRALCGLHVPRTPSSPDPDVLMGMVGTHLGRCTWKLLPPGATTVDFRRRSAGRAPTAPPVPSLPAPLPR